jgi:hypothetical protein
MTPADVLVLRSTSGDGTRASVGRRVPDSWPATWLPDLLREEPEEPGDDDAAHRYRGARLLYTAGCRYIEVTGSDADPTTVRLTIVWGDEGPSPRERTAFLAWWVTRAAAAGWEPGGTDELVGAVVVARYAPSEKSFVDGSGRPYVRHDWEQRSPRRTTRTSGRRT